MNTDNKIDNESSSAKKQYCVCGKLIRKPDANSPLCYICRLANPKKCAHKDCSKNVTVGDLCGFHRPGAMMHKHKCQHTDCEQQTRTKFCKKHDTRFQSCSKEGCLNRCKNDFCSKHSEKYKAYMRQLYLDKKNKQNNITPNI